MIIDNIFEKKIIFPSKIKCALQEKLNIYFLLAVPKFSFKEKDWTLGCKFMEFWDFLEIP